MLIKIPKYIEETINFVWENRKSLILPLEDGNVLLGNFDYPDYGGLNKKYSSKLTSGVVDWIQWEFPYVKTKEQVANNIIGTYLIEKR
jgi:hypothetical protein